MATKLVSIGWAAVFCVSAAWGQGDFIDSQALQAADLVKYWELPLPLQADQELTHCYLVDDQLYATTQDGYVFAVDANTGVIRWAKQITRGGYDLRRPCHHGNLVIFVLPPTVVEYDRYSGSPVRSLEMRFPTGTPAVSDGERIYIGGIDQKIYAFYADQDFETWKARAEGQILSQPALMEGNLFFADENGYVFSCKARNKEYRWRSNKIGSITADLATDVNGVYAASRDYSLYLLSPGEGHLRWRLRFPGPLTEPPVITPEIAFQYCHEEGVAAINPNGERDARKLWTAPEARGVLSLDENNVYMLGSDECILAADIKTGDIKHNVPAPGFDMFVPSINTTTLFLASKDGKLFCARKVGTPVLLASDVKQAAAGPQQEAGEATAQVEAAAEATSEEDVLSSKRPGPPIGGKSKVTREYEGD